jgi:hypothetical protein
MNDKEIVNEETKVIYLVACRSIWIQHCNTKKWLNIKWDRVMLNGNIHIGVERVLVHAIHA